MWARGGVCHDGARIPPPWTEGEALNHGFSIGEISAEPWLLRAAGCGAHSVELQRQDPASSLAPVTTALDLRRLLWKNEVFGPDDGGTWRVETGNLLICERSANFVVAVGMSTEPLRLPAGSVLLSAASLAEDGLMQPNNSEWVLRS